jgi:hypothetical protein
MLFIYGLPISQEPGVTQFSHTFLAMFLALTNAIINISIEALLLIVDLETVFNTEFVGMR